ncbi:MAG: type I DNA topoisomerase [Syntrophales bacterium]|nr:type I DNA topoisomerase [Syntrophales bacterium]
MKEKNPVNSLIIVESPTKVKTIGKYLGKGFEIRASVGHIKDLPKNKLGIDTENGFEPTYTVMETKKKVVAELKRAAAHADRILLAPDPDREGEAIAWHVAEEIGSKKIVQRVLFNDLTKETILHAIAHPRELNFDLYEAQQTRRILDRLVGYQISPILWEKVRRGLSAGRVQSVAVRIICDREEEIKRFKPEEFWNLTAVLEGENPPPFEAKLLKVDGKKAKVPDGATSAKIAATVKAAAFIVAAVEKKEVKRQAPAPFTTSKLQQEAARWLHFTAKKTMSTAQKLYEGIELGRDGQVGLITYMRTDSVRVAAEAVSEARDYIKSVYGDPFLPAKAKAFKVKDAAQDAHEAIRPTAVSRSPKEIKEFLSPDQFKLYQLIWNRFVASQMNPALLDQTTVDIDAANCLFRAQGAIMKFPGFTLLYTEGKDDNGEDKEFGKLLSEVRKGETLKLLSLNEEQKFTQPPPRFSEATLVRELEEKGIGRPSTYAAIISTIQDREYVTLEKSKFFPTDLGVLVTELLVKNFPRILDVAFTASLETQLDQIAEGQTKRLEMLNSFYATFSDELKKASAGMRNVKREEIPTDIVCEKCGSPMVIKWGKNGKFLACSNYPTCKNTTNFTQDASGKIIPETIVATEIQAGISCEKCGSPMVVKMGRNGRFLACSNYPTCKNTANFTEDADGKIIPEKAPTTDETCPLCGKPLVAKKGRYGTFFGCSGYPECRFILKTTSRAIPGGETEAGQETAQVCEKCGKPMVVKKGRFGTFLGCSGYPECKNIVRTSQGTAKEKAPLEITDVLCEKCGKPMAVRRGRYGKFLACTGYPECKNIQKYKEPEE